MSPKAGRLILVSATLVLLAYESWLGRKRLVAGDAHYLLAFTAFVLGSALCAVLLRKIACDAGRAQSRATFEKLQFWNGVLSGSTAAMFSVFGDYSQSKLNTGSVVGAIFFGFVFAVICSTTVKPPALVD